MEYPRIKTCIDTSVDDFISELYTPCFKWAERLDRGVGYFTSGWLEYNISGLSDFASRGGKIRLITSPILSNIDSDAIIASENASEDFSKFQNALNNSVSALEKEMKKDILNAFSWMLYDGIIELKFAIFNRLTRSAGFTIPYGNNPIGIINHIFVALVHTIGGVAMLKNSVDITFF